MAPPHHSSVGVPPSRGGASRQTLKSKGAHFFDGITRYLNKGAAAVPCHGETAGRHRRSHRASWPPGQTPRYAQALSSEPVPSQKGPLCSHETASLAPLPEEAESPQPPQAEGCRGLRAAAPFVPNRDSRLGPQGSGGPKPFTSPIALPSRHRREKAAIPEANSNVAAWLSQALGLPRARPSLVS